MQAISLKLPEELEVASRRAAKGLGISRAQFIRSAIRHEVRRVRIAAMANAMAEMSKDPAYMVEFEEWDNLPSEGLPEDEPGGWWEFPTGESKP